MVFIELLVGLVIGLALDLLAALLCVILFSVIGIPFLDALSFWQVFGLSIALSIMTWRPKLDFG